MALTLNGKRTGRAGSTDLAEQREYVATLTGPADPFAEKFDMAYRALEVLDPAIGDWYAAATQGKDVFEIYDLMVARIAELRPAAPTAAARADLLASIARWAESKTAPILPNEGGPKLVERAGQVIVG